MTNKTEICECRHSKDFHMKDFPYKNRCQDVYCPCKKFVARKKDFALKYKNDKFHSRDKSIPRSEKFEDSVSPDNTPQTKHIILDDNPVSIMAYAEEFPENWEKISKSLDKPAEISLAEHLSNQQVEGTSLSDKIEELKSFIISTNPDIDVLLYELNKLNKDIKQTNKKILERIDEINLKTASGRNRLPSIVLGEAVEIMKFEFGERFI